MLEVSLQFFTLFDVVFLNPLKMLCTSFPDPFVQLLYKGAVMLNPVSILFVSVVVAFHDCKSVFF